MRHKESTKVIAGVILLFLAAALQMAARNVAGFAEWYATSIYPWIVCILGGLCGLFPLSVVEILLYMLVIGIVVYIIMSLGKWKKIASTLILLLGILAFSYTANCGINYYRKPFSAYLDLEVRDSSVEELKELCAYLVEKINETVPGEVNEAAGQALNETAAQAAFDPSARSWNWQSKAGQEAMIKLGTQYPQLSGFYPRPKPVFVSWILAVQQLCGIYSPFTVEANYNWQMTDYNIPHTVCHELSHLRGFMREDEANFIGYLACIGSEDAYFNYSGYLTGWVYAGNALAKQDMESYIELHEQLPQKAVEDLLENNRYWNQYEGKVAEVSSQVNDAYLKINDQQEGVKSYGRMVDLMLAMRRKKEEI